MATIDRTQPRSEGGGFRVRCIIYALLVLLLLMALLSHDPEDAAVLSGGSAAVPKNQIGYTGAWISYWMFILFGKAAYVIVALLVLRVIRGFLPTRPPRFWQSLWGGILVTLGTMLLLALYEYRQSRYANDPAYRAEARTHFRQARKRPF